MSAPAAGFKRIFLAAALVIVPMLIQVLPLPEGAVRATGSGIGHFLANDDFASAADLRPFPRLSISPLLTLRAAVILAALAVLIAGLDARLARHSDLPRRLVFVIAAVALPIALFALIQKATFNGKIYWFWESEFRAAHNYLGPFVNRNHFAGWMLLAAAFTGGFLVGQIQTMGSRVKAGWRNHLLWLSSEEASRALLTTAALLVMLISIIWSMSRSGILGTALALILLGRPRYAVSEALLERSSPRARWFFSSAWPSLGGGLTRLLTGTAVPRRSNGVFSFGKTQFLP